MKTWLEIRGYEEAVVGQRFILFEIPGTVECPNPEYPHILVRRIDYRIFYISDVAHQSYRMFWGRLLKDADAGIEYEVTIDKIGQEISIALYAAGDDFYYPSNL
jgi:hypothetical protein